MPSCSCDRPLVGSNVPMRLRSFFLAVCATATFMLLFNMSLLQLRGDDLPTPTMTLSQDWKSVIKPSAWRTTKAPTRILDEQVGSMRQALTVSPDDKHVTIAPEKQATAEPSAQGNAAASPKGSPSSEPGNFDVFDDDLLPDYEPQRRHIPEAMRIMEETPLGETYPPARGQDLRSLIVSTDPYPLYKASARGFPDPATMDELERYYCGGCRQYLAVVPNVGARIGHYVANWMAAYATSLERNLTFIHHRMQPNQNERDAMDFFLGSSFGEHFFYDDICLRIANKECVEFLPCLTVRHISPDVTRERHSSDSARPLDDLLRDHRDECNVVFHEPVQPVGTRTTPVRPFMVAKYILARRKYPIINAYDARTLNVALHVRRGDIVSKPGFDASSRLTQTATYNTLIKNIEAIAARLRAQGVSVPRLEYHLFSQGKTEDFAEIGDQWPLTMHLNEDLIDTLNLLVTADIMVCARSGMSDMVAQVRPAYRPTLFPTGYWAERQPTWVRFDNDEGTLDEAEFEKQIRLLLRYRESGDDPRDLQDIKTLEGY